MSVPVVLLERYLDADSYLVRARQAAPFDVVRSQRLDSSEEWVFIGDDQHQLEVSLESARWLADAMGLLHG